MTARRKTYLLWLALVTFVAIMNGIFKNSLTQVLVMVKDVNEDMMKNYDIFTPIAKTDLGFTPAIPVINAGPILYRMPAMAKPVYDKIEGVIKKENLK